MAVPFYLSVSGSCLFQSSEYNGTPFFQKLFPTSVFSMMVIQTRALTSKADSRNLLTNHIVQRALVEETTLYCSNQTQQGPLGVFINAAEHDWMLIAWLRPPQRTCVEDRHFSARLLGFAFNLSPSVSALQSAFCETKVQQLAPIVTQKSTILITREDNR